MRNYIEREWKGKRKTRREKNNPYIPYCREPCREDDRYSGQSDFHRSAVERSVTSSLRQKELLFFSSSSFFSVLGRQNFPLPYPHVPTPRVPAVARKEVGGRDVCVIAKTQPRTNCKEFSVPL